MLATTFNKMTAGCRLLKPNVSKGFQRISASLLKDPLTKVVESFLAGGGWSQMNLDQYGNFVTVTEIQSIGDDAPSRYIPTAFHIIHFVSAKQCYHCATHKLWGTISQSEQYARWMTPRQQLVFAAIWLERRIASKIDYVECRLALPNSWSFGSVGCINFWL